MEPEIVGSRIRELMQKQNISLQELADKIKIDTEKLNRKLQGKDEFYINEMEKIREVFGLDLKTFDQIFFKQDCKI